MSAAEHFATLALADDYASRLLAKHLAQADSSIVAQAEAQGLIDKGYLDTMLNEGEVEGDLCLRDGCNGVLQNDQPLFYKPDGNYFCPECGYEIKYGY